MSTIIVLAIIIAAVIIVLKHKFRDFKSGKFCSCNCGGCSSKCSEKQE